METIRDIIYYGDFFFAFYRQQHEKVKVKIDFVLFMITRTQRIPRQYFQHVTDVPGLYEIRIQYQGNIYRVFCCFDKGNLIVLFIAFQKKSQKAPGIEINKAVKLMHSYFRQKTQ